MLSFKAIRAYWIVQSSLKAAAKEKAFEQLDLLRSPPIVSSLSSNIRVQVEKSPTARDTALAVLIECAGKWHAIEEFPNKMASKELARACGEVVDAAALIVARKAWRQSRDVEAAVKTAIAKRYELMLPAAKASVSSY